MRSPEVPEVVEAAQKCARAIRPVFMIEQGSEGKVPRGTAFLLNHESSRVIVTAQHVLDGPERKLMGISELGSRRWSKPYFVASPLAGNLHDPDVAYQTVTVHDRAVGDADGSIPLSHCSPGLVVSAGMSFIAVGFPVSKARFRYGQSVLRNGLLFASLQAVDCAEYERLGLDAESEIAVRYNRDATFDTDGNAIKSADPHGMSGGPLLLPVSLKAEDGSMEVRCLVAGVLVRYYKQPDNVLVATRIDALLDSVAPFRPETERRYAAAVVS